MDKLTAKQLTQLFYDGATPRDSFRTGTELEYFPVRNGDLSLLPYEGPAGVRHILEQLCRRYGWNPILEGPNPIALNREGEQVTLEPGGVIEHVISPQKSVCDYAKASEKFRCEIGSILDPIDANLLLIGFHPFAKLDEIKLVPKSRYQFMYDYMAKVGTRGREMMKLTAAVQIAVDYKDEKDAARKIRLAVRLHPFFVAMSANSRIRFGKIENVSSLRAYTWSHTDLHRTGSPAFMFTSENIFADYTEWVLDVPVYFIVRDGKNIPMNGATFREFLSGAAVLPAGTSDPYATESDWDYHLSTLFPWVRLKNYIELRSFDMNRPEIQNGLQALVVGIFNKRAGLSSAEKILADLDYEQTNTLEKMVIQDGLEALSHNTTVREICNSLIAAAKKGLPEDQHKHLEILQEKISKPVSVTGTPEEFARQYLYRRECGSEQTLPKQQSVCG